MGSSDPNPREADSGSPATAGTVTFLFTDVEGSTRLLRSLGAAWPDVLMAQRRLLREAIGSAGGREIDTAGDGFFVAFDRARDAVAAAARAQRALAEFTWPDGAEVRVRMGLHTGEPTVTKAGDYMGIDVHRASRICSAAHGGQVLLSAATLELAAGQFPAGVSVRDLGRHELKDLEKPEHLHQLVIEGLPSEFPPLRSFHSRPTNLPASATPLIGRTEELAAVQRLLLRDDVRWVTLTGPAGTGKTRLAIEVAARALPEFPDGTFLVQLASITDPELVPTSIARTLGLVERPGRPIRAELEAFLARRKLLLVLDNFEQVAAAAPVVAALLAVCESVEVLATSRVLLRISAEHEFGVPPLPLPTRTDEASAPSLRHVPAVALFIDRAAAASAGFDLTAENARAIASICRQLDGLPLAIELAAARTRLFPPHMLAERLGSRLQLLKGGSRDRPERHQTLRHALAWSHDLLGPTERAFFRRLSVFPGGFTIGAAEAVCGPGSEANDVVETLAALLDHSLIRRADGDLGEPRFVMLETIREFAAECLAAQPEEDAATGRAHAEWFVRLAESAAPHLTGPRLGEWASRLDAEHDNLRAALDWTVLAGDAELGLRLGSALWRFWNTRGFLREGRQRLERILALPGARHSTALRGSVLHGLATIIHVIGEFPAARPIVEECLAVFRELDDQTGIATVLNTLGWIQGLLGDADAARAHSREALERHTALGNRRGVAVALNNLALVAGLRGDCEEACRLYGESLAVRREIGDPRGIAYALANLVSAEHDRAVYEPADPLIDEALEILTPLNDAQLTAWALSQRARRQLDCEQFEAAESTLLETVPAWEDVGNMWGIAWTWTLLGFASTHLGRVAEARERLVHANTVWAECGMRWGLALGFCGLGDVARLEHDDEGALGWIARSLDIRRELGDRRGLAECFEAEALVLARRDAAEERSAAVRLLARASAIRESIGAPPPPRCRPSIRDALDRLRSTLGAATFAALSEEGRQTIVHRAQPG